MAAVDLSGAAMGVLREARAIASARGGTLAAVHVATNLMSVQPFSPEHYNPDLVNPVASSESRSKLSRSGWRRWKAATRSSAFSSAARPTPRSSGAPRLGGPT